MRNLVSRNIEKQKRHLDKATTFSQWKEAAEELDRLESRNLWKSKMASDLYNYELLSDRYHLLKRFRESGQTESLARALREGLHHDLGNMGDPRLYAQSYSGTKQLIEDYVTEVSKSLDYVCDNETPWMKSGEKLDFFKDILLSFGRPALLFSGGATMGIFHLGVTKALLEQDLLPDVITGSSAGSIIAAILGTHTDDELQGFFDPDIHKANAFRWAGLFNGLQGKGFLDQKQLQDYIRGYVGEYTMKEAYEKTGRSVNITVSPTHHNQKARLLSGYTSPYILMWSAALASCSIPKIFPPVKLMKMDKEGNYLPYMPSLRWVDGSVVSDLPIERLMHLYDVNYTIVSQTNPHVVPFLDTEKGATEKKWTDLPKKMLKAELQFHGRSIFDFVRKRADSEVVRQVSGQLYSLMSQQYYGDVTIAPQYKMKHFANILRNPDTNYIAEMILAGERATWPKISMIRTHAQISKTLEHCIERMKNKTRTHRATLSVVG